jgi:hypothetical protein
MEISRESILGAIVLLVALPSMFVGCRSNESAEKKASAPPAPKVTVSKAVKAKAVAPEPGPTATKADSFSGIGKGDASVSGAGHAPADYISWAETIDVADDGTPVQTDVAMDNKHKVLYLSKERSFGCANGAAASGAVLMAVYTNGNTVGQPAGSGWYAVHLDAGACAVPVTGLYGCRFDADGNPTKCGSVAIQQDIDTAVITEVAPTTGP